MKSNNMLHDKTDYVGAIKKMFPLGPYWDRQFDDEQSDVSLWVNSKAEELYRFKRRFCQLVKESSPKTADTMIDDWERVLLGAVSPHLPLDLRRKLLLTKRRGYINRDVLQETASLYGAKIKRFYYPYRSALFGQTRIGINRMCSPASFSVFFIEAEIQNPALKADFERTLTDVLSANMIVYFFYE